MNKATAWLWTGSRFSPCEGIPPTDRAFRYGMSVFESLPVRNRKPFFLPQHYERLQHACAKAEFAATLPPLEELDALLRGISFDAFARIHVTAGDGGPCAPGENPRVLVFAEPRAPDAADKNYKLALHPEPSLPLLGGLKTGNYWANLIALQTARERGCDEALLFNIEGALISACMANVFVIKDGKIKTPATDCGARAGVIREWVTGRRAIEEARIAREDVSAADEIFLTSSWLGVMPVASLEGRSLPSREVAAQLRVEYAREIGEGFEDL